MHADLLPANEQDVRDAIVSAREQGQALEVVGGGSKSSIGFLNRNVRRLRMTAMAKIINYDPAELILTVQPGARLAEVEALLAQHKQMLAFEPFDLAECFGAADRQPTIGGMVGAGIAGPRRLSAGGVRDHVLGFHAVNGAGEAFKAGGKVVKNVTGYDLMKLVTGAWGQLCVLTEITLKVLPRPEVTRTVAFTGLNPTAAIDLMARAMRAPADVAAASYVAHSATNSVTALRLEGFGPSVTARAEFLQGLLSDAGRAEPLPETEADQHWRKVRSAAYLPDDDCPVLWRIVAPPASGATMLAGLEAMNGKALLDWAGGLVWARTPATASAQDVRALAETVGGHAMLIDAPEHIRAAVPALHPEPPPIAALSRRVRAAFDPHRIFDPARFAR